MHDLTCVESRKIKSIETEKRTVVSKQDQKAREIDSYLTKFTIS